MTLTFGAATHKGKREVNEDAIFARLVTKDTGVFAVIDGMGEKDAGDVVRVTNKIINLLANNVDMLVHTQDIKAVLDEFFTNANQQIIDERIAWAGACLTVAVLVDGKVTIAHVGDTRAYTIAPDTINQLTRDHIVHHSLIDCGYSPTPEDLDRAKVKHRILYRALGQSDDAPEIDCFQLSLELNNLLLLCSNGVYWGGKGDGDYIHLSDEQIYDVIQNSQSPQAACDNLISETFRQGGTDDTSIIVISNGFFKDTANTDSDVSFV